MKLQTHDLQVDRRDGTCALWPARPRPGNGIHTAPTSGPRPMNAVQVRLTLGLGLSRGRTMSTEPDLMLELPSLWA